MKKILIIAFLSLTAAQGMEYRWESKNGEPTFSLDIPSDWMQDRIERPNGVLVFFRNGEAMIEIRSVLSEEEVDQTRLINMKAARLSARFNAIQLVSVKKSVYRPELILAIWKMKKNGVEYTDKTAFLAQDEAVVSVSCLTRSALFPKYATLFENAIYSIQMQVEETGRKVDINKLKKLFVFNRPNADKAIAAPSEIAASSSTTSPGKTTKTKKTRKKRKRSKSKSTVNLDNFLPPIE